MVKHFRKSSKLKPRRDGSEDDLFRKKKKKFKKLVPELDSDKEVQAKVNSVAKKTSLEQEKKTPAKRKARAEKKAMDQGKNLFVKNGYIPEVLFIEPVTDQTHAKKRVTKKKEIWMPKVKKTEERKTESRKKIVSQVQIRSSAGKSKAELMIEIKSKPGKNYFSKY